MEGKIHRTFEKHDMYVQKGWKNRSMKFEQQDMCVQTGGGSGVMVKINHNTLQMENSQKAEKDSDDETINLFLRRK